jgi:predicted nucleotidyltransferase
MFGSSVQGEQRSGSDLDFLIELVNPPCINLLGLVNLENYLAVVFADEDDAAFRLHDVWPISPN